MVEPEHLVILCGDEPATTAFAGRLAAALPKRIVVGLTGTLGAGKTYFVREVVDQLGGDRRAVVSPTYVLCQHYDCGDLRLNHLDAYRIQDDDEFLELGVDEMFDADEVTFIEWSERVIRCLPPERLDIELEVVDEGSRRVTLTARGAEASKLLNRLREL